MATQGPKPGRRKQVSSQLDRGSQEGQPPLGDRCSPSGVRPRRPDRRACLHPQAGGGLGEKANPASPSSRRAGRTGSQVRSCISIPQPALRPSAFRSPGAAVATGGETVAGGAREAVGGPRREHRALEADTTPSTFGAGNNGTRLP